MHVREIDLEKEYDSLKSWWGKRGLVPPSRVILKGAHGVAVRAGDTDVCAAWIYLCDKGFVAIQEWTVSNPTVIDHSAIRRAIDMLHDFMEEFAKKSGCVALFTSTQEGSGLDRLLGKRNWRRCEGRPHAHFIKELV